MDETLVMLRYALAVAVVLGAVGTSVDALAQDDLGEPVPREAEPQNDQGDRAPAPADASEPPAPAPVPGPQRNVAPPAPDVFVRRGTLPAPPPPPVPRPNETDAERIRAYRAWQYQYGVWQYQYDYWQQHKMAGIEPPQRWYGWQPLLIDAAAVSLVIAGAIVADSRRTEDMGVGMIIGGAVGGLLGPPIVHSAHGKWENAGISTGFRLGGAAIVFGSAAACSSERGRCSDGWAFLAVVGVLCYPIAVIVDAANSYEDVPPDEVARTTIIPWYDAQTRGSGLSVGRLF
jgi:hypothetical protein